MFNVQIFSFLQYQIFFYDSCFFFFGGILGLREMGKLDFRRYTRKGESGNGYRIFFLDDTN